MSNDRQHDYRLVTDLVGLVGEVPPDSIVSRTLTNEPGLKAVLFGFAPHQELSEHTASKRAQLYFVAGRAHITLGGAEHDVAAGAWVEMPAQMPHSIRAGDEPVTMLLMMIG